MIGEITDIAILDILLLRRTARWFFALAVRCYDGGNHLPVSNKSGTMGNFSPTMQQTEHSGARLVGAFTELPALIKRCGGDPDLVCSVAGVDLAIFSRADNFIRYDNLASILYEAARQTERPDFGLLSGRLWQIENLGLIGACMLNSPSVGAALREFELYQHLNSEGAVVYLLERDDSVDFGFAFYRPFQQKMDLVQDAGWIQPRSATGVLKRIVRSFPRALRKASAGDLKPRHFLGVRFSVMEMS